MAENNKYKSTYVYGNVVRKEAALPKTSEQERKIRERRLEEKRAREREYQKTKKLHRINLVYTLALIGAMGVLIYMLVGYVQLQASLKVYAAEITRLETDLGKLTENNNTAELELNTNINYEDIFRIATAELGMVYPTRGQVVEYHSTVSEYVKQYQDIPD